MPTGKIRRPGAKNVQDPHQGVVTRTGRGGPFAARGGSRLVRTENGPSDGPRPEMIIYGGAS
jgi:hypothetical protein